VKRTLKVLLLLTVALMLSIPSFAIQGDPTVIAFDDGALGHAVYAFAQSDSNTLVVNYGHHDLGGMQWADLGLPDGTSWIMSPSAVTYRGPDGVQYIDVFAESSSYHLVVDHWDGSQWSWIDLTAQAETYWDFGPLAFNPAAIAYVDENGNQQVRVFSIDGQHYLWMSTCDTSCTTAGGDWRLWQFYQITSPYFNNYLVDDPTAAHFVDSNGNGWTYVFADLTYSGPAFLKTIGFSSSDSFDPHLYSFGSSGNPGGTYVNLPAVVTQDPTGYVFQSYPPPCTMLHVFVRGNTLFDNLGCRDTFFNSGGSFWNDDGLPQMFQQGDTIGHRPVVVSYIDPIDGLSRYHVFINGGSTFEAFRAFWIDESGPAWFEQGFPPNSNDPVGVGSAIAFVDGVQFVYAFARDSYTGDLVVNFCIGSDTCDGWNGQAWSWSDQGTM
jgi:hypothetical protein